MSTLSAGSLSRVVGYCPRSGDLSVRKRICLLILFPSLFLSTAFYFVPCILFKCPKDVLKIDCKYILSGLLESLKRQGKGEIEKEKDFHGILQVQSISH